jgi:hypothetical protein
MGSRVPRVRRHHSTFAFLAPGFAILTSGCSLLVDTSGLSGGSDAEVEATIDPGSEDSSPNDSSAMDSGSGATPDASPTESGSDATFDTSSPDAGADATLEAGPTDAYADTTSDTGCGDVSTSANNCGWCGHSCQGGACSGGQCQLVVLYTDVTGPLNVTVDASYLYWTNNQSGAIWRVPIAGGAPTQLASGPAGAWGIAVDSAQVYWTNQKSNTVMMAPLAGVTGTEAPVTIASGQAQPLGIAVNSSYVMWSNWADGVVSAVPLGQAADAGAPIPLATSQVHPRQLRLADPQNLYWGSDNNPGSVVAGNLPMLLGGGSPRTVARGGFGQVYGIATNSVDVYWVTPGLTGAAMFAPLAGTNATPTLAASTSGAFDVVVDATGVYFANGTSIRKAPLGGLPAGGVAATVVSGVAPSGMAIDDTSLYWVETAGRICKLAK